MIRKSRPVRAVRSFPCSGGCNQVGDLGGGINVTLSNLSAGGSPTPITYLYGISMLGESVNGLISEIMADGGYYYIATQSSENGLYPALGYELGDHRRFHRAFRNRRPGR